MTTAIQPRLWRRGLLAALTVCCMGFLSACGDSSDSSDARSGQEVRSHNGSVDGTSAASRPRGGPAASAREVRRPVQRITAETVISDIADSLEAGHSRTEQILRRAGLGPVVDNIKAVDGIQVYDFEAETLLEEVYRRAEAHTPNQGGRVMAHLYRTAAAEFPAVAEDQAFSELRRIVETTDPKLLEPERFGFAPSGDVRDVPLPENLRRFKPAIRELAYVYSNGSLTELSRIATRAFGDPRYFRAYLAGNRSVEAAIRAAFIAHTPPPSHRRVLRTMMLETAKFPAAVDRPAFQRALANLGPEQIGFNAAEDRTLQRVAQIQDQIPSRQAQARQAASVNMPGSIEKGGSDATTRFVRRLGSDAPIAVARGGVTLQQSAQHFTNYQMSSFEGPAPTPGTSSGGGGGGGEGRKSATYRTSAPPEAYRATVAQSGAPRVSRTYRSAIRSARAARGVAAGANMDWPDDYIATDAAWMANPDDDRFGRVIIEVAPASGDSRFLVASRTLFADSFLVAADVLWGGHFGVTAYREGEILVVMSMDPFAQPDPARSSALEEKWFDLQRRASQVGETDFVQQLAVIEEMTKLQQEAGRLPRRIVIHPSLFGRELAWSVGRVDFWFNDLNGLSQESAQVNGGTPMPQSLLNLDISQASTWQFYERDGGLTIRKSKAGLGRIAVNSTGGPGQPSVRSHYSVSMFVFEEDGGNDPEGRQLPELERAIQPMLDWLAANHHDFMRLNDFSEAFSLLRWVARANVTPILVDFDGEPPPIATPDRVVIGDGPKVK